MTESKTIHNINDEQTTKLRSNHFLILLLTNSKTKKIPLTDHP